MSLAEIRQITADIQEILRLLDKVEMKTEKLQEDVPKTQEALGTFRQAERLALRYLAISRRLGLPDNISQAAQVISHLSL